MTPVWVCRVQGAVCEASYFSASTSLTSSQSTEDALPIMEINQSRRKSLLRNAERTLIASLCASPTDTHDTFPHQNTPIQTLTHTHTQTSAILVLANSELFAFQQRSVHVQSVFHSIWCTQRNMLTCISPIPSRRCPPAHLHREFCKKKDAKP